MALRDVNDIHIRIVGQAQSHLATAIEAYKENKLELMYFQLARAAAHIETVLAVIERIEDKPRNESANGPLPAREKRAH